MKPDSTGDKKEKLPKGIRQLPNGKFIADVCIRGNRRTKTATTMEEAIIARQTLMKTIPAPSPSGFPSRSKGADGWTLKQAYERTKSLYWEDSAWAYKVDSNFKSISAYFGETIPIKEITLDAIDGFVATLLTKRNSNGTINRKLAVLSRILRTAAERGKLESIPKMPLRKEAHHRVRFLSVEEENAFVKTYVQCGYATHADVFLILLYTGFRLGECWRIECRDIDLEHDTITAWKTKNGHPRTIPIVQKYARSLNVACRKWAEAESSFRMETIVGLKPSGHASKNCWAMVTIRNWYLTRSATPAPHGWHSEA